MNLHPMIVRMHIEATTASARRRRRRSPVWPNVVLMALCLSALLLALSSASSA